MANGDPFQIFNQMLKQFNSSEMMFDPSEFAMLGWPMTPLPIQGMPGLGSEMSPEAGTKRAVTQLYNAIESLDAMMFEGGSLPDGWDQALAGFTPDQFIPQDSPERVGALMLGTYQVWLYSLSQLLVESYTIRILYDELVVADHRNEIGTYEWLLTLSQPDREQLLRRCTDTDDELIDDMEGARVKRNELLYNFGGWEELALEDPVGDAYQYLQVLQQLDAIVAEGTGYVFIPGEAGMKNKDDENDDEENEKAESKKDEE